MVDQYSINSTYFKKIRNIFHQGLVHPWPYRIVRMALAALFIYSGVPVNAAERIIASPYTEKTRVVVLEKGKQRAGRWVEESVNVLDDYRKAFGMDPPATAGLAVMSDTDNAGRSAAAYIDFIEVYR